MWKCHDCGSSNYSFQEYCVRCGKKHSKSHRKLHSNALPKSEFVLDVRSR